MGKLEGDYKTELIKRIKKRLPGCVVQLMDSSYQQGIPEVLVLYGERWAILEVKKHAKASHRPLQDHFVEKFNDWSFAAFIYPENEKEVLDALQQALQPRAEPTRVSQR